MGCILQYPIVNGCEDLGMSCPYSFVVMLEKYRLSSPASCLNCKASFRNVKSKHRTVEGQKRCGEAALQINFFPVGPNLCLRCLLVTRQVEVASSCVAGARATPAGVSEE